MAPRAHPVNLQVESLVVWKTKTAEWNIDIWSFIISNILSKSLSLAIVSIDISVFFKANVLSIAFFFSVINLALVVALLASSLSIFLSFAITIWIIWVSFASINWLVVSVQFCCVAFLGSQLCLTSDDTLKWHDCVICTYACRVPAIENAKPDNSLLSMWCILIGQLDMTKEMQTLTRLPAFLSSQFCFLRERIQLPW